MSKPIRPVIINPDLEDEAGSSRKRVFIGLTMATSSLVCLALLLLWIVPFIGLRQIHPTAPWILGVIIAALVAIVGWASIGLVLRRRVGAEHPLFPAYARPYHQTFPAAHDHARTHGRPVQTTGPLVLHQGQQRTRRPRRNHLHFGPDTPAGCPTACNAAPAPTG